MTVGTVIMSMLSLLTAIPLIIIGTNEMPSSVLWAYVILALLSVLAAVTYTVGKKAYGYNGMGDVMVFIFFGLVSVLGVYSLYSKRSEEHTSELQSRPHLVCRLLLEKKNKKNVL